MRHLWSLIAGVVIAPLVWAVVAFGQAVTGEVTKDGPISSFSTKLLLAAAAFVGAGLLFGLIGTLRVSPAGPLVAGLAYLGSSALLVFTPKTAIDVFDRTSTIAGYDILTLPPLVSGVIPLLGGALLLAVFSAGRWRPWPSPVAAEPTTEPTWTQQGNDTSTWTTTPVSQASTEPTSPAPSTEATPSSSTWTTPYSSPSSTSTGREGDRNQRDEGTSSPWGPPPSR